MKKLVANILKNYQNSTYELQKKAYTFMLICLFVFILVGSIMIVEIIYGLPLKVILPLAVAFLLVICLFLIFLAGHYNLASTLFFGLMFVVITYVLLADFYDNPFDIYRYTLAATMMILVTGAISMKRRVVLVMTVLGLAGIAFFFWYRYAYQLHNPTDGLAIVSTITAALFYLFFGGIAYLTLSQSRQSSDFAVAQRDQAIKERDRSLRMLDILSLYTKPSLISRVIDGTNPAGIVPEKKDLSILFCDIRGFTALSENLEPRRIIELLNPYFTEMTSQVLGNNGEVDKLIGDGIMAIFESPAQAVQAALGMREAVEDSNLEAAVEIYNGIGIHHGEVVVGNLGSPWKMDNTVIGEVVNVSSRLEALTKTYKASIIISEEVYKATSQQARFILLDKILVKGSRVPNNIYGYFDSYSRFDSFAIKAFRPEIKKALASYFSGNFKAAAAAYAKIIKSVKLDLTYRDTYLNLMRSRCVRLAEKQAAGQISAWQGIYNYNE